MLLALNMNNTHTGTQRPAGCSWPYCIYLKMHMTVLNFVYSLCSHVPKGPRPQQHLEGCRNIVLESTKLKPCDWFIVDV